MFSKIVFYFKRFLKTLPRRLFYLPTSKFWVGIKSILITIPAAVIGYVSVDFKGHAPPGQTLILSYLGAHEILFGIILLLPAVLMVTFDKWENASARSAKDVKPDEDEFAAILRGIDEVVAVKADAISKFSLKVRSTRGKRADAFTEIVNPLRQIEQNMIQLYNVLRTLTKDDGIKLVLAQIQDGAPSGYAIYMPRDATPPGKMIKDNARKTMFFHAARDGKVKLIPDLEAYLAFTKAAQRIYFPSEAQDDKGSIICIPLRHQHWEKVVYCLSIKSEIPNTFTNGSKNRYKRICDYFLKRILIEHTLEMILTNTDVV
jgi:hypothetical protein